MSNETKVTNNVYKYVMFNIHTVEVPAGLFNATSKRLILSPQDLVSLELQELDKLWAYYDTQLTQTRKSLLANQTSENLRDKMLVEFLADIVVTRKAEQDEKVAQAERQKQIQQLREMLHEAQTEKLKGNPEAIVEQLKVLGVNV